VAQLNKSAGAPLLLGHRAADVLAGEDAKLASRNFQLTLVNPACSPDPCRDEGRNHRLPQLLSRLKHVLLGLPCVGYMAYYDAELDACPVCGCKERTSVISKLTQLGEPLLWKGVRL
jgi:hypothetical protein